QWCCPRCPGPRASSALHRYCVELLHAGTVEPVLWDHGLVFRLQMGPDVHARRIVPDEERFARLHRALHVVERCGEDLLVAGLHAFLGERAGVLTCLLAPRSKAWIRG